jgi:hypothetical protein
MPNSQANKCGQDSSVSRVPDPSIRSIGDQPMVITDAHLEGEEAAERAVTCPSDVSSNRCQRRPDNQPLGHPYVLWASREDELG